MSAALQLQPQHLPAAQPFPAAQGRPARPELRVLEGGRAVVTDRSVYVRRRIVAAAVLVVLVAAMGLAVTRFVGGASGAVPASGPGGAAAASAVVHVVEPGDTMWSVARELQPTGDVRTLVDELVEANGGAALQIGDQLVLPVRA